MVTKLDRELEQLGSMSRDELIERWQAAYGCPPPTGVRRELLMYAAGWHIQAKRLGGFSGEVRRMLRREIQRIESASGADRTESGSDAHAGKERMIMPGHDSSRKASANKVPVSDPKPAVVRRKIVPGTRLLREWNGKTHVVDVIEGGYVFEAKVYSSLTAIARRITGTHWSGPRFFGL